MAGVPAGPLVACIALNLLLLLFVPLLPYANSKFKNKDPSSTNAPRLQVLLQKILLIQVIEASLGLSSKEWVEGGSLPGRPCIL